MQTERNKMYKTSLHATVDLSLTVKYHVQT